MEQGFTAFRLPHFVYPTGIHRPHDRFQRTSKRVILDGRWTLADHGSLRRTIDSQQRVFLRTRFCSLGSIGTGMGNDRSGWSVAPRHWETSLSSERSIGSSRSRYRPCWGMCAGLPGRCCHGRETRLGGIFSSGDGPISRRSGHQVFRRLEQVSSRIAPGRVPYNP